MYLFMLFYESKRPWSRSANFSRATFKQLPRQGSPRGKIMEDRHFLSELQSLLS